MKTMIAGGVMRRRAAISAALAALSVAGLLVSLGAAPANATTSGTRCGIATMISVRGTNEAAGSGTANGGRTYASGGAGATLNELVLYANSDPNIPVYEEGLRYPAIILNPSDPLNANYVSSVQNGINNLVGEINDLASACPYTNILLGGYSQGAAVINNAIGIYHGSAFSIPALSAGALAHVTSVMLFGDPNYHPSEAWDASGNGTGGGVTEAHSGEFSNMTRLAWLPPSYSTQGPVTKVQSYCFTGDFFCQGNTTAAGMTIHGSYGASNAPLYAWVFSQAAMTDEN